METDTKKTEMTLEETFARLDAITAALEDPSTGLEASFALYKEGSELLKQAGGKIDLVQKQVQVLQQASGGADYTLRPFDETSFGTEAE